MSGTKDKQLKLHLWPRNRPASVLQNKLVQALLTIHMQSPAKSTPASAGLTLVCCALSKRC